MINQKEKLQIFFTKIKNSYYYNYNSQFFDECYLYLSGDSNKLPSVSGNDLWVSSEIGSLLDTDLSNWGELEDRLMDILTLQGIWNPPKETGSYYYSSWGYKSFTIWMRTQLRKDPLLLKVLETKALKYNIDHYFFVNAIFQEGVLVCEDGKITEFGQFILEKIDDRIPEYFKIFKNNYLALLELLLKERVDLVDKYLNKFMENEGQIRVFEVLLNADVNKYEPAIEKRLNGVQNRDNLFFLLRLLVGYLPEKYSSHFIDLIWEFLENEHTEIKEKKEKYNPESIYLYDQNNSKYYLELGVEYLLSLGVKGARERIYEVLKDCYQIPSEVLKPLVNFLGQDSLDLLAEGFKMNINELNWRNQNFFNDFFRLLVTLDYRKYENKVWELTCHKSKKMRELSAIALSKRGEEVIDRATELLKNKKADIRQTGALILSLIKTDRALEILNGVLETEKNDDARDLMLEGLREVLLQTPDKKLIQQKAENARKRGKLNQPLEAWLNPAELPELYFTEGSKLDSEMVHYFLYRMSRAKDIRIDPEAKLILDLLDKSKSAGFANSVLKAYFNLGGADSKQKYCLTIGSVLGGDSEIDLLKRKVIEWAEASRGKMAEYAVKAIALNGSIKALRVIEFYSRKYKSKFKNIGAAANESFTLVAEELGIAPYELADTIIPDFGFKGLFKEFEANGDTYRAFVGNDFKMAFLNEDNKQLKSLPKGTSKEIQEEFKEIAKEIRDVVKSQSGRMEQYLVIQRRWQTEKWKIFFMNNPVMFVYAVRLVWGVFNNHHKLLYTFMVQEDQSFINEKGEEIELETDSFIGMVHPAMLTEETTLYWKRALYESEITTIFPQLDRKVILFDKNHKGVKICNDFSGIEMGGYAFITKLDKLGWFRGSVVDGGMISGYYKDFSELGITAIIRQQGLIGAGYFEENAALGSLMFVTAQSVKFGSYTYDEPENENDPRLIELDKVPIIVYSEVMADMQFFKENDLRKQNGNKQ